MPACKTWNPRGSFPVALTDSGHDFPNHPPAHVGQPEVTSGITIRQPFVIEVEAVEDRGVQVVDARRILHGLEAELIRRAKHGPTLDAAAARRALLMSPDGGGAWKVTETRDLKWRRRRGGWGDCCTQSGLRRRCNGARPSPRGWA